MLGPRAAPPPSWGPGRYVWINLGVRSADPPPGGPAVTSGATWVLGLQTLIPHSPGGRGNWTDVTSGTTWVFDPGTFIPLRAGGSERGPRDVPRLQAPDPPMPAASDLHAA